MTRNEARFLHASNLLVGGTGLVYAWMRYLCEPADEFSRIAHPAQPHVQHAHVVLAPLLVFAVGLIWSPHVWRRIQSGFQPRRSSGKFLALLLLPMTLSGYLLQVSIEPAWRDAWIVLHVATSILWCAVYALHLTLRRRRESPDCARQTVPGSIASFPLQKLHRRLWRLCSFCKGNEAIEPGTVWRAQSGDSRRRWSGE